MLAKATALALLQAFLDLRALWRTRSADPLLTMRSLRQLVATQGNGFRISSRFVWPSGVGTVATGCNRWAP